MSHARNDLPAVIETTMQVIVALRWAAQQRAVLPEPLDVASQDVLRALYEWQRQHSAGNPPQSPANDAARDPAPAETSDDGVISHHGASLIAAGARHRDTVAA